MGYDLITLHQTLKILVTAWELQQKEHRGIAVFSKNLITALHDLGHEVWILTEFAPKQKEFKRSKVGIEALRLIRASDVVSRLGLHNVNTETQSEKKSRLARILRLPTASSILKLKFNILHIFLKTSIGLTAKGKKINIFPRHYFKDSPFLNEERTHYLANLSGIVSIQDIFLRSDAASQAERLRPFTIVTNDFDLLIKTCPHYITLGGNGARTLDVIHDFIPLLQIPSGRPAIQFAGSLSIKSKKVYISEHTRNLYATFFPLQESKPSKVVIQPPSIRRAQYNQQSLTIPTARVGEDGLIQKEFTTLQAFKYLLFNSALEARKNVELIIRAFQASGLSRTGYKLILMGKIIDTNYAMSMLSMASETIIFTDYVNDVIKAQAFLQAACVVSASAAEGFGIPVLDAACMGTPVLASSIPSHHEIYNLYDFKKYIQIIENYNVEDWGTAILATCRNKSGPGSSYTEASTVNLLKSRSQRFDDMHSKIWADFCSTISICIEG
ncbi:glycosyltransferase [Synechococcus sp. CBW1107]|uniref:glycosyltransferase n=1 Tax=Synechococcus sp. CBW1107 TaxID=2789857 RepID=UPI002AD4C77F|nr:glycosyltransferase [Synechococcus sp. CBW1107]